ncbi:PCC domain-containing protein [Embleya sp. NPDC001921]
MNRTATGLQLIELKHGELMEELAAACAKSGVTDAAVVSLIGAVDAFTVSTMPADDATRDIVTDYDLPAEMTGTGEITGGVPHLHVVMAVEGDRAIAGHLHRARIGTWFARIYLHPLG